MATHLHPRRGVRKVITVDAWNFGRSRSALPLRFQRRQSDLGMIPNAGSRKRSAPLSGAGDDAKKSHPAPGCSRAGAEHLISSDVVPRRGANKMNNDPSSRPTSQFGSAQSPISRKRPTSDRRHGPVWRKTCAPRPARWLPSSARRRSRQAARPSRPLPRSRPKPTKKPRA